MMFPSRPEYERLVYGLLDAYPADSPTRYPLPASVPS